MAGFMNAELVALKERLSCAHCNCTFAGSDSQTRKVKYEKANVYCSTVCRMAAASRRESERAEREGKTLRKGVLFGPCKHCGGFFESRIDKMYCSMKCYTSSEQFREIQSQYWAASDEVRAKISDSSKKGAHQPCMECGQDFYVKRHQFGRRKFCTKVCYRSYFAKRFDRWVASPEGLSLPQCYDEFLDRERLRCLVEGCDWEGVHLSSHMNQSHGVPAREFKRAAGFNYGTGVIARPLARALQERPLRGVASDSSLSPRLPQEPSDTGEYIRYKSLEGCEHRAKALSLTRQITGPMRVCNGCRTTFHQSTPMGRALYCSIECRNDAYARKRRSTSKVKERQSDGTFRWKDSQQDV